MRFVPLLCAVPDMAVLSSSLISCCLVVLLRYCLSHFEMVAVAHIITGITFAFTFHMRWIFVMRFLYYKIFSASFLITFLSPGITTSINLHAPGVSSRTMMFGLLLGRVLSFRSSWFHSMVTLPSWPVSNDFGAWPYQCWLSDFTPVSWRMLKYDK
jgi:hypothetical protein